MAPISITTAWGPHIHQRMRSKADGRKESTCVEQKLGNTELNIIRKTQGNVNIEERRMPLFGTLDIVHSQGNPFHVKVHS